MTALMNIAFTPFEEQLVSDSEVLLTKNTIIQKVYKFFGELSEIYQETIAGKEIGFGSLINPKVSRGENYLGLPYVILDFPRQFGKTDIFAIRSLFWWGNFFSITLHLAGGHLLQNREALKNAINKNIFSGWYIAIGENQWDHHFEEDNYIPLETFDLDTTNFSYFKIAKKIPLSEWDKIDTFFIENFSLLINTLAT